VGGGALRQKQSRRQKYVVQKFLMQANSHCNSSTAPQPRKPSHAIMADTINVASKQTVTFLPVRAGETRGLLVESCKSTR
jgi:hypothetical protein